MNPAKAMAKLSAGSQDPESMAMPPGGGPGTTPQDISAALSFARVSRLAEDVGRAKLASDADARLRVFEHVRQAADKALGFLSQGHREFLVHAIASLLLEEYVDEPVCRKCKGAGERRIKGVWQACPTCDGSGRTVLSDRERARRIGVDKMAWHRHWVSRYTALAESVTSAERECLSGLKRQLDG